jgi:hypothetical protein
MSEPRLVGRRGALWFTSAIAALYALVATVITIVTVIQDFAGGSIQIASPIRTIPLRLNPTMKLDGVNAAVGGGGFDHATLDLSGLSIGTRSLLAAGQVTGAAIWILIAIALVLLCNRIALGNPFGALITRALTVSAFAVLIGGFASEVCLQLAQSSAIKEAFGITSGQWTNTAPGVTPTSAYWPSASTGFDIDFWPLGLALGLFALAVVFRYGQSIERDRSALREEVRGLV